MIAVIGDVLGRIGKGLIRCRRHGCWISAQVRRW